MFVLLPYNLLGSPSEFNTPSHYPAIEGTYNTYVILHGTPLITVLPGANTEYPGLHGAPSVYVPLEGPPNTYPIIRG